jgi:hypothetical protein
LRSRLTCNGFDKALNGEDKRSEDAKETDVAGHVEQMHLSLCYRRGGMGCVSCHDPHRLPEATEKTSYYRSRCLKCHAEKDCAEPLSVRRKQGKGDNCVACHMPRTDSASVNHVVLTDHRILRRPTAARARPPGQWPGGATSPFVPFYRAPEGGNEAEDRRDYGLALMQGARARQLAPGEADARRSRFSEKALPLLDDAVARHPEDVPAREARAHALWFLGRPDLAWLDFERVIGQAPEREDSLAGGERVAELLGRTETAIDLAERLVRVNPWAWEHHYHLAGLLAQRQQWRRAAEESKEAVALEPWSGEARSLRVRCLLAAGERREAEEEFRHLLPMLADPEAARLWFAEEARRFSAPGARDQP